MHCAATHTLDCFALRLAFRLARLDGKHQALYTTSDSLGLCDRTSAAVQAPTKFAALWAGSNLLLIALPCKPRKLNFVEFNQLPEQPNSMHVTQAKPGRSRRGSELGSNGWLSHDRASLFCARYLTFTKCESRIITIREARWQPQFWALPIKRGSQARTVHDSVSV